MIEGFVPGDITHKSNGRDIIIGMNSDFEDVTGIGKRFVKDLIPDAALKLGSVISFDFDRTRRLHLLICHHLGEGGWHKADEHVRFGMDYLHFMNDENRSHSIVQIGAGRIGLRDGADSAAIVRGMTNSHLPVTLYIWSPEKEEVMADVIQMPPMRPLRAWNPVAGELQLAA